MLDGAADGTPPLDDADALRRWVSTMTREFEALRGAASRGTNLGVTAWNYQVRPAPL